MWVALKRADCMVKIIHCFTRASFERWTRPNIIKPCPRYDFFLSTVSPWKAAYTFSVMSLSPSSRHRQYAYSSVLAYSDKVIFVAVPVRIIAASTFATSFIRASRGKLLKTGSTQYLWTSMPCKIEKHCDTHHLMLAGIYSICLINNLPVNNLQSNRSWSTIHDRSVCAKIQSVGHQNRTT